MAPFIRPGTSPQSGQSDIYTVAANSVKLPATLMREPETFRAIASSTLRRMNEWTGSQILVSPYIRTKHVLPALMMDEVFKKLLHGTFDSTNIPGDDVLSSLFSFIVSALGNTESGRLKELVANDKVKNLTLTPRVAETWKILEKDFQDLRQLHDVPTLHRWKFIIEPAVCDALRALEIDVDHNPLQGFIFDTEPEYAYRLAVGMHTTLRDTTRPLTVDLLKPLLQIFGTKYATYGAGFSAHFSKQGIKETISYMMALARTPRLKITTMLIRQGHPNGIAVVCRPENPNPAKAIYHGLDQTSKIPLIDNEEILSGVTAAEEALSFPGDSTDSIYCTFFRADRRAKGLQRKLTKIFDTYALECISDDTDVKLRAALKVYVECERLHAFNDSNFRVFGTIILNFLLAQQGQAFTTLRDPNHSDGSSLAELLDQAKAGQQMWNKLKASNKIGL